jgi:hypothetical protein
VALENSDEHAIGYQVLPRGVRVEASDGTEVGRFHKAIHHAREHMLDGVVIETEKGRVFVDAPEIARITNRRIILTIDSGSVGELPPYRGFIGRRFR